VLIALVLLVIAGFSTWGFMRFEAWRSPSGVARHIADSATVAGFVRVSVVDVYDGGNSSDATAYFIGPAPRPDPLVAVSVPTIKIAAVAPEMVVPGVRTSDVVARGQRSDGCGVSVSYPTGPIPDSEQSNWKLTAEQRDEVRKGTQALIALYVYNCGW
jgi:hypothetical protein